MATNNLLGLTSTPDLTLNKSIDHQIYEAKLRAQSYTDSLREAKEHELQRIQQLENEKKKWIESYERKSVLVSQLENELSSTVEMIELQRRAAAAALPQNVILEGRLPLLTDQVIHEDLKKLFANSPSRSFKQSFQQQRKSGEENGLNSLPTQQSIQQLNTSTQDETIPTATTWNNVLNQYKEQLLQARSDIHHLTQENEILLREKCELEDRIHRQADDIQQLQIAREDLQAKSQFRLGQIREYEEEKVQHSKEIKEWQSKVEELEIKVYSNEMRYQLLVNEKQRYIEEVKILKEQIVDNSQQEYIRQLQLTTTSQQQQIQDLQAKLVLKDTSHSEELQQLKQMIQSLQLRLRHSSQVSADLIVPSTSVIPHRIQPSLDPMTLENSSTYVLSPIVRDGQSRSQSLSSAADSTQSALLQDIQLNTTTTHQHQTTTKFEQNANPAHVSEKMISSIEQEGQLASSNYAVHNGMDMSNGTRTGTLSYPAVSQVVDYVPLRSAPTPTASFSPVPVSSSSYASMPVSTSAILPVPVPPIDTPAIVPSGALPSNSQPQFDPAVAPTPSVNSTKASVAAVSSSIAMLERRDETEHRVVESERSSRVFTEGRHRSESPLRSIDSMLLNRQQDLPAPPKPPPTRLFAHSFLSFPNASMVATPYGKDSPDPNTTREGTTPGDSGSRKSRKTTSKKSKKRSHSLSSVSKSSKTMEKQVDMLMNEVKRSGSSKTERSNISKPSPRTNTISSRSPIPTSAPNKVVLPSPRLVDKPSNVMKIPTPTHSLKKGNTKGVHQTIAQPSHSLDVDNDDDFSETNRLLLKPEKRTLQVVIPTSQPLEGRRNLYDTVTASEVDPSFDEDSDDGRKHTIGGGGVTASFRNTTPAAMGTKKSVDVSMEDINPLQQELSLISLSTNNSTGGKRQMKMTKDSKRGTLSYIDYRMKTTTSPLETQHLLRNRKASTTFQVSSSLLRLTFSSLSNNSRKVLSSPS